MKNVHLTDKNTLNNDSDIQELHVLLLLLYQFA